MTNSTGPVEQEALFHSLFHSDIRRRSSTPSICLGSLTNTFVAEQRSQTWTQHNIVKDMADNQPQQQQAGTVQCQCRDIYHWRNNVPCTYPPRWCQWCMDGGCTLQRQADARRDLREIRGARGGNDGPPMLGCPFPMVFNPFGPQVLPPGEFDSDSEGPD